MRIKKTSPATPLSAPPEAAAAPVQPPPPSPAVLKLQDQVVELVARRGDARKRLSEAHATYLLAQSGFQAAEADVRAAEQDAQYLLGLIAQLENRATVTAPGTGYAGAPVLQMPSSLAGVTSEPAQPAQAGNMALSPPMTRREIMGMM